MKAIMPLQENTSGYACGKSFAFPEDAKGIKIAESFFDASEILLFDADASRCTVFRTSVLSTVDGRDMLKELGVAYALSQSISPLARNAFSQKGIACVRSAGSDLFENIEMLKAGRLEEFEAQQGVKACSGESCASCASSCGSGE